MCVPSLLQKSTATQLGKPSSTPWRSLRPCCWSADKLRYKLANVGALLLPEMPSQAALNRQTEEFVLNSEALKAPNAARLSRKDLFDQIRRELEYVLGSSL